MIFKVFRNLAAAFCCVLAQAAAAKPPRIRTTRWCSAPTTRTAPATPSSSPVSAKNLEGHVLEPWLDYWRLSMRLEDADNREVREFFATHANQYVAERMRADWLRVLGKRGEWPEFDRQAARYNREDLK